MTQRLGEMPPSEPALEGRGQVPARRRARAEVAEQHASSLRAAIVSLAHTVRFLEDLMVSRQVETERAVLHSTRELDELRQRIQWVEELASS